MLHRWFQKSRPRTSSQASRIGDRSPVVLHILPQDGIGGAELAANSAARNVETVHLQFLCSPAANAGEPHPRIHHAAGSKPIGVSAIQATLETVRRVEPDLLVFSLWKTFLIYLAAMLLWPRRPRIVLLHSDRPVHPIDKLITDFMMRTASAVWADSERSLLRAHNLVDPGRMKTLSFLVNRLVSDGRPPPRPGFVFWGRLNELKNVPLALQLVSEIKRVRGSGSLLLIGPDAGSLAELRRLVRAMDLGDDVEFAGCRSMEEIVELSQGASFFLQLSRQEGMAMAVVEAMQLGLVPVVTPVGEIANYCRHMENGIVYRDLLSAVAAIGQLIDYPERYNAISREAVRTWQDRPLYADEFAAAAHEVWLDARTL